MKDVRILAQDIMDAYYQDYKEDNEDFFDLDYFVRAIGDSHASILREEYIEQYKMLRQENRHLTDMVTFSTDWLKDEILELKKSDETGYFHAKITGKVFQFPYDQSNCGYQVVAPVKRDGCTLKRTTISEVSLDKFMPENTIVFWYVIAKGVLAFDKDCCKKVRVYYVDADALDIPDGLADRIKDTILARMFGAKSGRGVINVTNDSNPNAIAQSEINKETMQS